MFLSTTTPLLHTVGVYNLDLQRLLWYIYRDAKYEARRKQVCEDPRATVREVDGELVLDDPDAVEVARAVEKHSCRILFEANAERVGHFVRRFAELGLSASEGVIVLLNVDDPHGGHLAEALMPDHD